MTLLNSSKAMAVKAHACPTSTVHSDGATTTLVGTPASNWRSSNVSKAGTRKYRRVR